MFKVVQDLKINTEIKCENLQLGVMVHTCKEEAESGGLMEIRGYPEIHSELKA